MTARFYEVVINIILTNISQSDIPRQVSETISRIEKSLVIFKVILYNQPVGGHAKTFVSCSQVSTALRKKHPQWNY